MNDYFPQALGRDGSARRPVEVHAIGAETCEQDLLVRFACDYMGRRVRKQVLQCPWDEETDTYAGTPVVIEGQRFVYDGRNVVVVLDGLDLNNDQQRPAGDARPASQGWNVVMVLQGLDLNNDEEPDNTVMRKYTWGLDLSGQTGATEPRAQASGPGRRRVPPRSGQTGATEPRAQASGPGGIHGAGGIGGLLAMYQPTTTPDLDSRNYWFLCDGNGNVTDVLDATAPWWGPPYPETHYEYDPYGNTTTATLDPYISPFRFSTKWFDTETDLYYYGYRYYSPRLGRWMSRDPIEEEGGVDLYAFVANEPSNRVDYTGLWKIERSGGTRAVARAELLDNVNGLARMIGLDPADYRNWLGLAGLWELGPLGVPSAIPNSSGQDLEGCEVYRIPNTVLAYWDGNFSDFGQWWVMWNMDIGTLRARGFLVDQNSGWSAATWQGFLSTRTTSKEMHGIFYWGHGVHSTDFPWWDPTGLLTGENATWVGITLGNAQGQGSIQTYYRQWNPQYRLAFGALWACGTDPAASGFFAANGVFAGFRGVGVPHGLHLFGKTVAELLPPGAQGTRR